MRSNKNIKMEQEDGFFHIMIMRSPAQDEVTLQKLHISISHDLYLKAFSHKEEQGVIEIKKLHEKLKDAINDGIIMEYKFIDPYFFEAEHKFFSEKIKEVGGVDEGVDINQLRLSRAERVLNGDQFTLYPSANLVGVKAIKKLRKLCLELETILESVQPGQFAATESPISPHISLRQDLFPVLNRGVITQPLCQLLNEYKLVEIQISNTLLYIPAVLPAEIKKLDVYSLKDTINFMINTQEKSDLYRALCFTDELKLLEKQLILLENELNKEKVMKEKGTQLPFFNTSNTEKQLNKCKKEIKSLLKDGCDINRIKAILPSVTKSLLTDFFNEYTIKKKPDYTINKFT